MGGGRLGFSRVRLSYRQANRPHHFQTMPRRKRKSPLPLLLAELSFASWETIHRRTLMMARGACSPAEYSRMIGEGRRLPPPRRRPPRSPARGGHRSSLPCWVRGTSAPLPTRVASAGSRRLGAAEFIILSLTIQRGGTNARSAAAPYPRR